MERVGEGYNTTGQFEVPWGPWEAVSSNQNGR